MAIRLPECGPAPSPPVKGEWGIAAGTEPGGAGRFAGLSLRHNFAWSVTGNFVYGFCQWIIIVALAKLTSPYQIGQFSLGLAIATPVFMFTNLQLRAVQAVDTGRRYEFGEYLGLRTLTTLIGGALAAAIAVAAADTPATAWIVLAVVAAKAVETFSEVIYGLFQLNNRLDQIGKSMVGKGVASALALAAVAMLTRNVFWGVMALGAAWMAVLVAFDVNRARLFLPAASWNGDLAGSSKCSWRDLGPRYPLTRQWALARTALPLGVVMTLGSLNMNVPRYFVQKEAGAAMLGIFSSMAYVMVAVVTVADAMGHSATPRLARFWAAGAVEDFRALLVKLLAPIALLGAAAVAAAELIGAPALAVLYGPEYAAHSDVFVWLMAAAAVGAIAALLTYGLTSARRFRAQVPLFVTVTGCNVIACSVLVPRFGLKGAALATLAASVVHTALAAGLLARLLLAVPAATLREETRS